MPQFHNSDPENPSFYEINNTVPGNVLQLDALDRKQLDVMLAPLIIDENKSEDDKLAEDEVVERIQQLNERIRVLNERRGLNGQLDQPQNIADMVQDNNRNLDEGDDWLKKTKSKMPRMKIRNPLVICNSSKQSN